MMSDMNSIVHFLRKCRRTAGAVLVFFALSLTHASGQNWPFELWHDGKIVLTSGDTLKGAVKYDLQQDLVQYTSHDKTVVAFTPRKILFFEIFDNTVNSYRRFFSLPYSSTGAYETLIFFELLEEGKLTLLSREALEYRSVPIGFYGGSYNRLILVHYYFFMDEKGRITQFSGKRNDLIEMFGKHADTVQKYMRTNRLRFEEKPDFARIIAYYNSLFRS
jgi:hypothetical protein